MRLMLLAILGCHLCLLVVAAPQSQDSSIHIVDQNTIEDESNAVTSQAPAGVSEEASTKGPVKEESTTGAPVQEIPLGEKVVNEPPAQEQATKKGDESEPTKEDQLTDKPAEAVATESNVTNSIEVSTSTEKPTKKPVGSTTARPLQEALSTSARPPARYPCRCGSGICSCCTGVILENFNVPIRSRACANVTYQPEDFAFNFKLLYNNRLLYTTQMSAKNPRPVCIPINRFFGIKMCAKLSNVYMSGRNIHACLDMEGYWDDERAFQYAFNCFRIGSNGIAVVRPEDGGGLPPPPDEEEQTDEDYDDSARELTGDTDADYGADSLGWVGDVKVVQN